MRLLKDVYSTSEEGKNNFQVKVILTSPLFHDQC